ncbi:unnamed protein product [Brachionus calyciflorus]|uniref:Trafficking protein particle complex subunit 12 n=1 Tax=Brachionus calyciflorus TaxID=104777 RepID=A0A813UCA3_9BILA|nr:unnamed protein product [Brachionus calyciflorus]
MSNLLASYFTNNGNDIATNTSTTDIAGRSFFDLISDCKDFNEKEVQDTSTETNYHEIWPYPVEKQTLNNPFQFAITDQLPDPVKFLVTKHFGTAEAAKRVLPNADSVLPDANGLQILIKCGCFRSVINLTYKILTNLPSDQLYSSFTFQIWFIRIAIMLKMKLFKEAEKELKQFDNFERPEFFYDNQIRRGTFIPFGLRCLNAELAHYLANSNESLCNLYKILSCIKNILIELPDDENAKKIWNERELKVKYSISNILLSKKNYQKALEMLYKIAESDYSDKNAVWSSIGKIFAQFGDVLNASNSFIKAKTLSNSDLASHKCRNLLNLSILKIMNSQYKEAYEYLKEANELSPDNPTILNNMSFCLFYSGDLLEAIKLIESKIHSNPTKYLNESLLFNLCTLYELESSKALQKKLNLLLWLNIYAGDGFNETCIQLP